MEAGIRSFISFSVWKRMNCRYAQDCKGVIYGVHTDQIAADPRLRTRFDVDEWFGTVINRFVSQAVAGIPLTIYGSGGQTRGFIALRDAMQCMTRLITSPPEPGQYGVVNQISGVYMVRDLADTVAKIAANEFNLPVKIQRLENPRVEADEHPFEVIYEQLPKTFGFEPKVSLEEEVLNSAIPVLVDFWASWCPPCKMTEPLIDKLAQKYDGKVKIGKINVDQNPRTAAKYGIKGIPTFITFKSGEIVEKRVGAQTEEQLRKMLNTVLEGE